MTSTSTAIASKTQRVTIAAVAAIREAEFALSMIDLRTLSIGPDRQAVREARIDLKAARKRLASVK